jgi:segregation and condensation protein A|tara:strand:+ start:1949 stop:2824 length:876 start_codon:yes stop_codon:yes gene_type:complete
LKDDVIKDNNDEILDPNQSSLDISLVKSELPSQNEMPFAIVSGEPLTEIPQDLYIPPQALKIFLETFEGPLDLLLYLIRRQNIDILDIPIADISLQYTKYIDLMQDMQFELAGEYLLMAATLAEIKSRMLLPRPGDTDDEEEDPRAELIRRLQEYERFKKASEDIDFLDRVDRDNVIANNIDVDKPLSRELPDLALKELLISFQEVVERSSLFSNIHVQKEPLSIREKMTFILSTISERNYCDFSDFFDSSEGRMGITVSFLAILELLRNHLIDVVQTEPYSPIHITLPDG